MTRARDPAPADRFSLERHVELLCQALGKWPTVQGRELESLQASLQGHRSIGGEAAVKQILALPDGTDTEFDPIDLNRFVVKEEWLRHVPPVDRILLLVAC